MLDIKLIREKPEEVKAALAKRLYDVDFTELLQWESERKRLQLECETMKARRGKESAQIPILQKQGKPVQDILTAMQALASRIQDLETQANDYEKKVTSFVERLPNLTDEDVPAGGKEANAVVREFGKKPAFDFTPKDHVDLVKNLGLIDYERGVKMGGNGYWLYKGDGALMEWALLNYFIEEHRKDGYEFVLPPHILTWACGYTAGQFPKFEDDVFKLAETDGSGIHFLLPTSETALINLYRDEMLKEEELPRKYFAYTPCYRKEAGSYRAQERGMIRGHQFNKVEMFQFTRPEDSPAAFEELVHKAERLVQGLGLHHRVTRLAAADCSAGMAKTFDIEVWMPSMNEYKEVSSISNARDYQARRGQIRFKRKDSKKSEFIHSLNASGLATSRIFPAIMEQHQQKDGSVVVPEPLRKFLGKEVLRPR
jgi:seryl-tRNA synthetase